MVYQQGKIVDALQMTQGQIIFGSIYKQAMEITGNETTQQLRKRAEMMAPIVNPILPDRYDVGVVNFKDIGIIQSEVIGPVPVTVERR